MSLLPLLFTLFYVFERAHVVDGQPWPSDLSALDLAACLGWREPLARL